MLIFVPSMCIVSCFHFRVFRFLNKGDVIVSLMKATFLNNSPHNLKFHLGNRSN